MAIKLAKRYLQENKYNYTWKRDQGDGEYAGKLDRIKVDKDEGYEVLYFIESLMNKLKLDTESWVKKIENALHSPELSAIILRKDLEAAIEKMLFQS